MKHLEFTFNFLRDQTVGIDSIIDTPFGKRLMVYCDYNASGRCLKFIEKYIMRLQKFYANTHTEDDITGRSMTQLLNQAEEKIKKAVNAGPHGRIICVGSGSTSAIYKAQQILGVALPAATRSFLWYHLEEHFQDKTEIRNFLENYKPVVFVGPYEHHSNELTWRESLAEVVIIKLNHQGFIDIDDLETKLQKDENKNRLRIGSFSAASNVTGVKTPIYEITCLLHKYNAIACFDYAASAPYVDIDMNPEPIHKGDDPSIDAIFISPHKFLGGPGSNGILIFNKRIYHNDLAPSVGGGGTVTYVTAEGHEYFHGIEERERAGTPGVLQTFKASLVFSVKERVTVSRIEKREQELILKAFQSWKQNPDIELLGNTDPDKRISIASFNIHDPWGTILHAKFITALLNDLFGIQSRAGCSCAGPYGHYLLNIDTNTAHRYWDWVNKGCGGMKPGWCRVGFHYTMDDSEAQYIIDAVNFIGSKGYLFLSAYKFHLDSGVWTHKNQKKVGDVFSLDNALNTYQEDLSNALPEAIRKRLYKTYIDEAYKLAEKLQKEKMPSLKKLDDELRELQYFSVVHVKE
ncbi:MAG: aminotransferase class V-fold PLP-dependent enzyme [bacterium]